MIFLSHKHSDNKIVKQYAEHLANEFGRERIKLDLWSARPGDSIIEFMSKGIEKSSHFVLFWSAAAARSSAVQDEWQAALMKSYSGELSIVVVKLDETDVPPILAHRVYINHADGIECCAAQLIEFASGSDLENKVTVADDIYYHVTFCSDDSLLIELYSVSEALEIGPFMVTSNVHHDYLHFVCETDHEIENIVAQDVTFDGRNAYGLGFRFKVGGISCVKPAKIRLVKLKKCGVTLSRLQLKSGGKWNALPLNKVTDQTVKKEAL